MQAVFKEFNKYLVGNQLPGKGECEKFIRDNPVCSNRTWNNVKDFIRNHKRSNDAATLN